MTGSPAEAKDNQNEGRRFPQGAPMVSPWLPKGFPMVPPGQGFSKVWSLTVPPGFRQGSLRPPARFLPWFPHGCPKVAPMFRQGPLHYRFSIRLQQYCITDVQPYYNNKPIHSITRFCMLFNSEGKMNI